MLNVLVLTDYFLPHASGGVERAAYEVSRRIAEQGHAVTVLTFRRGGAPAVEQMDGLSVVRVSALDLSHLVGIQLSVSLHVWPAIRRIIKQRRIDVVHAHGLFFHASLAGAVLGRLLGVPVVTTAHVGSLKSIGGVASRLSALYQGTAGRLILASSKEVIAVSEAVAEHVQRQGAERRKINVIANGVDAEHYSPAAQRGHTGGPRMIFVGRLITNKGPQHLLDALPEVIDRFPAAECWFVGDGPLRRELERRAREAGLERNVSFLGERDDVPDLLRQSDVFVRPSLSEGLPLAVLEAMASGLPVLATPVGGTPELVEDDATGFLIEPSDVSALKDRLVRLLGDEDLRENMGRRGRQAAVDYDWDFIGRRTLDVYQRAVAGEDEQCLTPV